jgi:SAM-dependent methyltransferase
MKARTLARKIRRVVEGRDRSALREARRYVATDEESGRRQLALLQREGCRPSSRVLEVGCGALHAGIPTIEYLDPGNWVGIDPNGWLIDAALTSPGNRQLVEAKRATFLNVDDFDASSLGRSFDHVLSHSVLSHAAHWQLPLFLHNVVKVLAPAGRIIASIRLAEGNAFGSIGSPDGRDSHDESWVYPGVSWFTFATVEREARSEGLEVSLKPEYTEVYIAGRNRERHDWLVFSRTSDEPDPSV